MLMVFGFCLQHCGIAVVFEDVATRGYLDSININFMITARDYKSFT